MCGGFEEEAPALGEPEPALAKAAYNSTNEWRIQRRDAFNSTVYNYLNISASI